MKKQLLFAFGAAALLASCSSDFDSPSANVNDGYLKVNGTIGGVQTRMDGTKFENNDQIGVNVTSDPQNVSYTYTTAFAATEEGIKVAEEIQVSAYYPYTADLTSNAFDFTVVGDANAPKTAKEVDLLFAPAVKVTTDNTTANFQFAHVNSQISLTLVDKTSDEILKTANTSIALNNVAVNGTFNTINGVVTPKTANGTIAIASPSTTAANVVIVPSYATDNQNEITVVVKVDEVTYTGKIKPVLKAANRYNYNLNINDPQGPEEQDLEITGTIGSWTDNTGGGADQNGDVDVEPDYVLSVGDFLLKDGSTIAPSALTDQNKDKVVGVVYYVGNPQPSYLYSDKVQESQDILKAEAPNAIKGLAVAINNANNGTFKRLASAKYDLTSWWEGSGATKVNQLFQPTGFNKAEFPNQFCGYNNTRILEMANQDDSENTTYGLSDLITILKEYNSANSVEGASKWFLTSYAEFNQIATEYETVNASIVKANGTLTKYNNSAKADTENFYWTSDYRNGTYAWVSVIDPYEEVANAIQTKNSNGTQGYFRLSIAF